MLLWGAWCVISHMAAELAQRLPSVHRRMSHSPLLFAPSHLQSSVSFTPFACGCSTFLVPALEHFRVLSWSNSLKGQKIPFFFFCWKCSLSRWWIRLYHGVVQPVLESASCNIITYISSLTFQHGLQDSMQGQGIWCPSVGSIVELVCISPAPYHTWNLQQSQHSALIRVGLSLMPWQPVKNLKC